MGRHRVGTTLVVLAKEPIPGRVKTRLHPALTLEQAAQVAAAAIDDTIEAVAGLPVAERVLAYDGIHPPRSARGYRLLPQTDGPLDERLAAIFDAHAGRPLLLIGMDTPQVSVAALAPAFAAWPDDVDAWFGPAADGGWWALGLRKARGDLIRGIPCSRDDTGARQLARLRDAGLTVGLLPTLTDVDEIDDAITVAGLIPESRFAAAVNGALELARVGA
jgi:glycosyltransferase A (GT-A) superfamily protein (DUF2064 family)